MAVDSSADFLANTLLEKLRLDDSCFPPRSWDSVCSQGGASHHAPPNSSLDKGTALVVSEPSLVRLALNALQGVETALISIEKLFFVLGSTTTDRTHHKIPSLWTRCSSTLAVGNLLSSIGRLGCIVFLLRRFVSYFTVSDFCGGGSVEENPKVNLREEGNHSLVNSAFAIAVGKVVDGYISALNTLFASVSLRRSLKTKDGGCLTSIEHSEITLLEVHLHTVGLGTQIEALGNLCNVCHLTHEYPLSSLEDLKTRADMEFSVFPRSGALLSFLFAQLKVADPDHCGILKFFLLRSYEPYCDFIRSWIYDGSISDPYHEFVVESIYEPSIYASNDTGSTSWSPLPTVRVRDGVVVPCFLEECLVPLCRTGQQLQIIMKLLELSINIGTSSAREEILPRLDDMCNKYPGFAFSLTFDKGTIETLACVRSNYYEQLLEKAECSLARFDFSSHKSTSRRPTNAVGKSLENQASSAAHEGLIPSLNLKGNIRIADNAEVSSTTDEDSYAVDGLESSDCSSTEFSDEENDAEQLIYKSDHVVPCYLSALDFSLSFSNDNVTKNLKQSQVSCSAELIAPKVKACSSDQFPDAVCSSSSTTFRHFSGLIQAVEINPNRNPAVTTGSWSKYDSTFFSRNRALNKGPFFYMRTALKEEYNTKKYGSSFDFDSSVEDPVNATSVKLDRNHVPKFGTQLLTEAIDTGIDASNLFDRGYYDDATVEDSGNFYDGTSLHMKGSDEPHISLPNISGGSSWETLLGHSDHTVCRSLGDHMAGLVPGAGIPLDFVIKRCLLDEISYRYNYVSKLTIKLLIEGFKLQEHFQALRCYHFMELADWADLFIMSLSKCKWVMSEVDKRIPEIQGILELALQRSSCDGDSHKDRLYVYLKGDAIPRLSASALGIHSFDFLGLGYQIEWPVSIILTPGALKIYSYIFNFLMKVKLAVFSLSDTWCSLKGYRSKQDTGPKFSFLTETRHKINHFVSALQQYTQSQLSHVSWLKFIQSLKHKVKDMLDLESVHMAYLTESLHICFLSDETQTIAGIIQNILQCAIDLQSCLLDQMLRNGSNVENSSQNFSQMNFSQVHSIRRTFYKNLEELHSIYLKSSKQEEFGISRFWDYLDYNEYYAGVMSKQKEHCIFNHRSYLSCI